MDAAYNAFQVRPSYAVLGTSADCSVGWMRVTDQRRWWTHNACILALLQSTSLHDLHYETLRVATPVIQSRCLLSRPHAARGSLPHSRRSETCEIRRRRPRQFMPPRWRLSGASRQVSKTTSAWPKALVQSFHLGTASREQQLRRHSLSVTCTCCLMAHLTDPLRVNVVSEKLAG